MNATKSLIIGLVCANVCARQLVQVSTDTKLVTSNPQTTHTNGIGAELDVYGGTTAYDSTYNTATAVAGANGTFQYGFGSTGGYVSAAAPNATGNANSGIFGGGNTYAGASPNGTTTSGGTYESGGSSASGNTDGP